MRKFNLLLVALVGLTVGLVSCKPPITEPVIAATTVTFDLNDIDQDVFLGTVSIDANDAFVTVTFKTINETSASGELVVNSPAGNLYTFALSANELNVEEDIKEIVITVVTENKEASLTVAVSATAAATPLAKKDFEWKRVGGNAATGDLAIFGLEWKSNTLTHIVITPATGVTLVQFADVEKWNTITTLEELEVAFAAETPIEKFEVIPTKDDTKEFNYVLATKKADGTYTLINPTKRVLLTDGTSTRTVTGEYKVAE